MAPQIIAGWDIGGVHLKVARAEAGRVVAVRQVPCTLWLGEEHLRRAFDEAGTAGAGVEVHAITMTGELAENFGTRKEGVQRIVAICEDALPGRRLYYAGAAGFFDADQAIERWQAVASANWRASAGIVAALKPEALFVDIGSTTTDIVAIREGEARPRGETDAERMLAGELVYTGAIRTSLMVLADRVPFQGVWHPVMAENFSTAADLYRLSGELDPADDLYPASDGRSKDAPDCVARLARMIGRDAGEAGEHEWRQLAAYFRERQLRLIHDAATQVLSGAFFAADAPVIGAGAGHFLAKALAARLNRPYMDFGTLIEASSASRRMAGVCAPAAALALLASARAAP